MKLNKTIFVNFGINKEKYRSNFDFEGEIQKYLRVFSHQILSVLDYLYDFLNTYRFFPTGYSYKGVTKNFPSYFLVEDGADQQNLRSLARSFNINKELINDILFEWESKFIEKTTEIGIDLYIRHYFKYFTISLIDDTDVADEVYNNISTNVFEWNNNEISEISSNIYFNEINSLSVYLEISLPKKYSHILMSAVQKIKEIFLDLNKLLAVGIKIKFIEFIWR